MERGSIRTFENFECRKACRDLRMFVAQALFKALPKDERYRSIARDSRCETLEHMITANDEQPISNDLLAQGRIITAKAVALLDGYIFYLRKAAGAHPPLEGGSSR